MSTIPQAVQSDLETALPQTRDLPNECMLLRIFLGEAMNTGIARFLRNRDSRSGTRFGACHGLAWPDGIRPIATPPQREYPATLFRLTDDPGNRGYIRKNRSLPARTKTNDAYRIDHRRTGPNCSVSSLIGFCFIKDCLNAFDRYQAGTQDAFNCSEETLNLFLRVDDLDHDRKIER